MLILTTNAFDFGQKDCSLPEWPGVRILVVLPESGLDGAAVAALNESFIVLEWLEPQGGIQPILHDVARWLPERLRDDEGPLLCLDRPLTPDDCAVAPSAVPVHVVTAELADDGRLVGLIAGEMVKTSPLLPEFLRITRDRGLSDKLFVELLTDNLSWSAA